MIRTSAYRFTTENLNDARIDELKNNVKIMNLYHKIEELEGTGNKQSHRVVVRARLGKNNPNAARYRLGGDLYQWSSQTIRPEHGQRFDVYVQVRR